MLCIRKPQVVLLLNCASRSEIFRAKAPFVAAVLHGIVVGDVPVLQESFEAGVDSVTSFFMGNFHEADELFDFSLTKAGTDTGVDS
jgi:hypothetical protein